MVTIVIDPALFWQMRPDIGSIPQGVVAFWDIDMGGRCES
jgi:hypothetical protein